MKRLKKLLKNNPELRKEFLFILLIFVVLGFLFGYYVFKGYGEIRLQNYYNETIEKYKYVLDNCFCHKKISKEIPKNAII